MRFFGGHDNDEDDEDDDDVRPSTSSIKSSLGSFFTVKGLITSYGFRRRRQMIAIEAKRPFHFREPIMANSN